MLVKEIESIQVIVEPRGLQLSFPGDEDFSVLLKVGVRLIPQDSQPLNASFDMWASLRQSNYRTLGLVGGDAATISEYKLVEELPSGADIEGISGVPETYASLLRQEREERFKAQEEARVLRERLGRIRSAAEVD